MARPHALPVSASGRGGPQIIPRPGRWRRGPGDPWAQPGAEVPRTIRVADVEAALRRAGEPEREPIDDVPVVALPSAAGRPAAVVCLLFDEEVDDEVDGAPQAHVILTRRSSGLRSHSHQVSFPGGRLDPGESAEQAARREAQEEIGIDPAAIRMIGSLRSMRTVVNPSPITPFVAAVPSRPTLVPNPAEVERAFTVPLVELMWAATYHQELWTFPDGREVAMPFYELDGDTVWGATARMLTDLLLIVTTR